MPNPPEDMLKNILNDPQTMEKINSLLGSMDGSVQKDSTLLDPEMLSQVGKMMTQMSEADDKGVNLIMALKPYLSERRIESADMAVKFLKLSKLTSLMENFNL